MNHVEETWVIFRNFGNIEKSGLLSKRTIKRFKFVTITHMNRIIVNILPWNCFENKHPLFILDLCLYTLFCE